MTESEFLEIFGPWLQRQPDHTVDVNDPAIVWPEQGRFNKEYELAMLFPRDRRVAEQYVTADYYPLNIYGLRSGT